jgi:hypothetical protein
MCCNQHERKALFSGSLVKDAGIPVENAIFVKLNTFF